MAQSSSSKEEKVHVQQGLIKFPDGKLAPFVIGEKHNLDDPGFLKPFVKEVVETLIVTKNKPQVLFSVTGAAKNYAMPAPLEQVFREGLVKAAQATSAWIMSGGTDEGVMKNLGDVIAKSQVKTIPTIGITTWNVISHDQLLLEAYNQPSQDKRTLDYVMTQDEPRTSASGRKFNPVLLNPNHTHFILVKGPTISYGHEIPFLSNFENELCALLKIRSVLIVINGGPNSLQSVLEAVRKKFHVVLLEGSGRAADAIAYRVKKQRGHSPVDAAANPWSELFPPGGPDTATAEKTITEILPLEKLIVLFDPANPYQGTFDQLLLNLK